MPNASKLILLLPMLASGCLVIGVAQVKAPERLPQEGLPPLSQPVSFDVCIPARSWPTQDTPAQRESSRRRLGDRIAGALARASVVAELTSTPGRPVRFTVTEREETDHEWSMVLSGVTFSLLPGYMVERRTLDVELSRLDSSQPGKTGMTEHLRYGSATRAYFWAPLIVYPDFIWSPVAGWSSSRYEDGGFERTIARLADDLRDRLGRGGPEASPSELVGVACSSEIEGR